MLRTNAFVLATLAIVSCLASGRTHAQATCARSDFEAVVDDAAAALRRLNADNKPAFQELLRTLKEKRGWDHDTFLREATPFVQDENIDAYDQKSQDLLADIASVGEEGTSTQNPDCALLEKLRGQMQELVASQTAKWSYMFAKLQKEIDK